MDSSLQIVKSANLDFKNRSADATWEFSKSSNSKTEISAWETTVKMKEVDIPLRYVKFLKKITNNRTNKSKYS